MKKIKILIILAIIAIGSVAGNIGTSFNQEITGIWLGTMKVSDALELRIAYIISDEEGKLSATMNIIDQNAFDIPMDSVFHSNGQISIEFTAAGISFVGQHNELENTIDGIYSQGDSKFELNLNLVDKLPGPVVRTQTPKGPFPYTTEDVIFQNDKAGIDLAGTITVPESGEKFPAIILIHGSGHTDRNETSMGHFNLLADYFTRNGFIVLRFDKRGVGSSQGNYDNATTFEFAEDVKAGMEYLMKRSDVDPLKIGLIGHSEGSLIAPMIAAEKDKLDFIVLLGCMGVNGGEIRLQQTELILELNGAKKNEIEQNLNQIKSYHKVISESGSKDYKFKKIKELHPDLSEEMINYLLNPWYQTFISLEPSDYLEKVNCPVLALTGEKDVQCPAEGNLPQIEKALRKGGNQNFEVLSLPSLNHLLQTAESGLPIEYENIAEIISPSAMQLMLDWIQNL